MSLPQAIRISLNNSYTVRVVKSGAADGFTVIAPHLTRIRTCINSDRKSWLIFGLSSSNTGRQPAQVERWVAETAANRADGIVKRQEAKILAGKGADPNLADVQEQLERFKLDLVDKTAEQITAERQLRNILGLPAADKRRIVPTTKPLEAEYKPNWDESLVAMRKSQPDITESESILNGIDPSKAAPGLIKRQKEFNQQVLHQTTHSLYRFFLAIDSNYKMFNTATGLKDATKQRLDAQAVLFEKSEIPIDRYLEALRNWSNAVAQEASFKCVTTPRSRPLKSPKAHSWPTIISSSPR